MIATQLSLIAAPMAVTELQPGVELGEVFTKPWIVEMILDLAGYTADVDLGANLVVEPACGLGAFLLPVVDRLIDSCALHGRSLAHQADAIRAYDIAGANVERARKAVVQRMTDAGLPEHEAQALAATWIVTNDFLLHPGSAKSADFVVGNPPYIRLEDLPRSLMAAYRRQCPTMRGRADVYVGFFERGLDLLRPGGALAFICADRWMHNQYGAALRDAITASYAMETIVSLHDVAAFEDDVSAYPAVAVIRNAAQETTAVVDTARQFASTDARQVVTWARRADRSDVSTPAYEASEADTWFNGRELWPSGRPGHLALLAELEGRFTPIQDARTGTRVGIGVATGCDDIFVVSQPDLVEEDHQLPLLRVPDIAGGTVQWSGTYLVDPWDGPALADLARFPRLRSYFEQHADRLRARHTAQRRPAQWYRTIDRVDHRLLDQTRLVLPDMKSQAHPVLDDGPHYPHHNLYYVVSDGWDLEVLGGLLLSDVTNLFVGAYCVKMRGGCYRFQAQYLRQIRVPALDAIPAGAARELKRAFADRDRERATAAAATAYGIEVDRLR